MRLKRLVTGVTRLISAESSSLDGLVGGRGGEGRALTSNTHLTEASRIRFPCT